MGRGRGRLLNRPHRLLRTQPHGLLCTQQYCCTSMPNLAHRDHGHQHEQRGGGEGREVGQDDGAWGEGEGEGQGQGQGSRGSGGWSNNSCKALWSRDRQLAAVPFCWCSMSR